MTADNEELDTRTLLLAAAEEIRTLRARVAELEQAEKVWFSLVEIVGCTSHDGHAELQQVEYAYERASNAESQLQQVKADAERLKIDLEAANKKARRNGKYADQVERAERAERLLAENKRTNNA